MHEMHMLPQYTCTCTHLQLSLREPDYIITTTILLSCDLTIPYVYISIHHVAYLSLLGQYCKSHPHQWTVSSLRRKEPHVYVHVVNYAYSENSL